MRSAVAARWLHLAFGLTAVGTAAIVVGQLVSDQVQTAWIAWTLIVFASVLLLWLCNMRLLRLEIRARDGERREAELNEKLSTMHRVQAVGQLAGGVAHDFNNLLMVLMSQNELLKEGASADSQRMLEEQSKALARGAALTRQLLALARNERVEPRVFDISDRIEGLKGFARTVLGDARHLHIEAPPACWISADPVQFEQVVINLICNAKDAVGLAGHVSVCARLAGDRVELVVEDDGPGFADDILARVFEPFFTTKSNGRGTGLGLATVHAIVCESGGSIRAENRAEGGARVVASWPLQPSPCPANDEADVTIRAKAGRILIVDDLAEARDAVQTQLTRAGFEVLTAASAVEA